MALIDAFKTQSSMSPNKKAEEEDFRPHLAKIHKIPLSLSSPVNLDISEATSLKLPHLEWHNYEKPPKKMKITNTGQTVVLSGKWFSERPYLVGGALKSRYVFSQMHFHWGGEPERGSEHTVEGYRMPLEMHLVHFKAEYGTQDNALRQDDGIVVIGCFFKLQSKDNPVMLPLTDKLVFIARPHTSHNVPLCPIASLFAEFSTDYLSYWGSMCSDDCQHTILWCFPRKVQGISREQMLQFQHLVNDEGWPLRLDEHSVNPLGDRSLFLVNASGTRLSATFPGINDDVNELNDELLSSMSSIEAFGSKTSISSPKQSVHQLTDDQLTSENSATQLLVLKESSEMIGLNHNENETTDLPMSAKTDSILSALEPFVSPATDGTDSQDNEIKDLCNVSLAHNNYDINVHNLTVISTLLTDCQENPPATTNAKEQKKIKGSSEELLKAVENLRLEQDLWSRDDDTDLFDLASPSLSQTQVHLPRKLSEEKLPLGKNEPVEVKRYKVKAPFIPYKAEVELTKFKKTPVPHASKGATKKRPSPRLLPISSAPDNSEQTEPNSLFKMNIEIPNENSNALKVSSAYDENISEIELWTRELPDLLSLDSQNSSKPRTSFLIPKLISNETTKVLNDTMKPAPVITYKENSARELSTNGLNSLNRNSVNSTAKSSLTSKDSSKTSKVKKNIGMLHPNSFAERTQGNDSLLSTTPVNKQQQRQQQQQLPANPTTIRKMSDPNKVVEDTSKTSASNSREDSERELNTFDLPFFSNPTSRNSTETNFSNYSNNIADQIGDSEETNEWNMTTKPPHRKNKPGQQNPAYPTEMSWVSKGSPAKVTVSLAGCWKNSASKEKKSNISSAEVHSVLDKLEQEVSATLRLGKSGELFRSQGNSEPELDSRTVVLESQDSCDSINQGIRAGNEIVSLYLTEQLPEIERNESYLLKHVNSWRKDSIQGKNLAQIDGDGLPVDTFERRTNRRNSLLMEAAALLKEHRQAVVESYNQLEIPESVDDP